MRIITRVRSRWMSRIAALGARTFSRLHGTRATLVAGVTVAGALTLTEAPRRHLD